MPRQLLQTVKGQSKLLDEDRIDTLKLRMGTFGFIIELLDATMPALSQTESFARPTIIHKHWEPALPIEAHLDLANEENLVSYCLLEKHISEQSRDVQSNEWAGENILLVWRFRGDSQRFQTMHRIVENINSVYDLTFNRNKPAHSSSHTSRFEEEVLAHVPSHLTEQTAIQMKTKSKPPFKTRLHNYLHNYLHKIWRKSEVSSTKKDRNESKATDWIIPLGSLPGPGEEASQVAPRLTGSDKGKLELKSFSSSDDNGARFYKATGYETPYSMFDTRLQLPKPNVFGGHYSPGSALCPSRPNLYYSDKKTMNPSTFGSFDSPESTMERVDPISGTDLGYAYQVDMNKILASWPRFQFRTNENFELLSRLSEISKLHNHIHVPYPRQTKYAFDTMSLVDIRHEQFQSHRIMERKSKSTSALLEEYRGGLRSSIGGWVNNTIPQECIERVLPPGEYPPNEIVCSCVDISESQSTSSQNEMSPKSHTTAATTYDIENETHHPVGGNEVAHCNRYNWAPQAVLSNARHGTQQGQHRTSSMLSDLSSTSSIPFPDDYWTWDDKRGNWFHTETEADGTEQIVWYPRDLHQF